MFYFKISLVSLFEKSFHVTRAVWHVSSMCPALYLNMWIYCECFLYYFSSMSAEILSRREHRNKCTSWQQHQQDREKDKNLRYMMFSFFGDILQFVSSPFFMPADVHVFSVPAFSCIYAKHFHRSFVHPVFFCVCVCNFCNFSSTFFCVCLLFRCFVFFCPK